MDEVGRRETRDSGANALVLLLGLTWGLNWIATRFALDDIPLWPLRSIGLGLGAATLFAVAAWRRTTLRIPAGQRLRVLVAGFFNVALYNAMNAYAQSTGATSRAVVVAYTMPIWSTLLAVPVLSERFTRIRVIALFLCASGLTILVQPLFADGFPLGALYALVCAISWAIGTIYLKWAQIDAEPLTTSAWQLLAGFGFITVAMLVFDGWPQSWPLHAFSMAGLLYNGLIGFGIAYLIWFIIVERLPTATAAIGALLVPVVGFLAAILFLGERPTLSDVLGFALIFTAAACVLLQPSERPVTTPE
jgi:drug/metabolite transporter (DMT)-like permease